MKSSASTTKPGKKEKLPIKDFIPNIKFVEKNHLDSIHSKKNRAVFGYVHDSRFIVEDEIKNTKP